MELLTQLLNDPIFQSAIGELVGNLGGKALSALGIRLTRGKSNPEKDAIDRCLRASIEAFIGSLLYQIGDEPNELDSKLPRVLKSQDFTKEFVPLISGTGKPKLARIKSVLSNGGIDLSHFPNVNLQRAIDVFSKTYKNAIPDEPSLREKIRLQNSEKRVKQGDKTNSLLAAILKEMRNSSSKDKREAEFVDEKDIKKYLSWVIEHYGTIELRGIRWQDRTVIQLPLDEVYVPLTASVSSKADLFFDEIKRELEGVEIHVGSGTGIHSPKLEREFKSPFSSKLKQIEERSIELDSLLSLGKKLIVTGGPGSGKTTVLLHLAYNFALARLERKADILKEKFQFEGDALVPFFIPLSSYADHLRAIHVKDASAKCPLHSFIARYIHDHHASLPQVAAERLIEKGEAIVLLDGLDEIPSEDNRAVVRESVEELVANRKNLIVVITCRTAAYRDRTTIGKDFQEVKVMPLEPPQVEKLIVSAYQKIYPNDETLRSAKLKQLIDGIRKLEEDRRRRLGAESDRLVQNPLIVRMFIIVQHSEINLPEQRIEVFMKVADALLKPEYSPDQSRVNTIGSLVGGDMKKHLSLSQFVAFSMHKKGETQGIEIKEEELRELIASNSSLNELAEDFIAVTRTRGTLLEEHSQRFRFIHLAFQEFLVARYIAERIRSIERIIETLNERLFLDPWWREVILLLIGYLNATDYETARELITTILDRMDAAKASKSDFAQPRLAKLELLGLACVEWRDKLGDIAIRIASAIQSEFISKNFYEFCPPALRAATGRTLSSLGDPRKEVTTVEDMLFCFVPKGPFLMGSKRGDPMAHNDEFDQHQVDLEDFWMSKYPITNAQYQLFIEDGGYQREQYWTKNGWKLKGDRSSNEKYVRAFELDNHPVVGVSWYEAFAFTQWLSERQNLSSVGLKAHLPSEAEWEKAARGGLKIPHTAIINSAQSLRGEAVSLEDNPFDSQQYPWGNKPDENSANYSDSDIGTTSAVGCFPNGKSPYGCEEMSGNVWEWTRSLDGKKKDAADDNASRVLRGGSFSNSVQTVRCSFRYSFNPYYRYNLIGFRVVLSPL